MYVYLNSEPGLYTVGFYDPSGKWIPESDYTTANEAADRVMRLNGGSGGDCRPSPILRPSPCAACNGQGRWEYHVADGTEEGFVEEAHCEKCSGTGVENLRVAPPWYGEIGDTP